MDRRKEIFACLILFMMVCCAVAMPNAQALASLDGWTNIYSGRTVIFVIGDSVPHGPWNIGASAADSIAAVDIASVMPADATTLTRLDTEVINEWYGGFPAIWHYDWKSGYTTQDIIMVGGPVVNSAFRKYNYLNAYSGPMCKWNYNTWAIQCSDGYSTTLANRAFIAFALDGSRQLLLVTGYTAFGTRAAGVILKYAYLYPSLMRGYCVVFVPIDNDGDGIFEVGESVLLLHQVGV